MSKELIKEVNDLPNPERNLLTHNERELINLCYRLRDAIEALEAQVAIANFRIAELESENAKLRDVLKTGLRLAGAD